MGENWKRADNSGSDWHRLIGLNDVVHNDRRRIIFVIEGSKDALVAAELARRCGILAKWESFSRLAAATDPLAANWNNFVVGTFF